MTAQDAGHAWAEAFVPGLGWVAFDAANGICATDAHVRVAVGLDYLGAAPVRGTRYGGAGETLAVSVQVAGRPGRAAGAELSILLARYLCDRLHATRCDRNEHSPARRSSL